MLSDFFEGTLYFYYWIGFIAVLMLIGIAQWLTRTKRWHIMICFVLTMAGLAVALPIASKQGGGVWDFQLTNIFETVLFGFTLWFILGGESETDGDPVTRRKFHHRRVDSVDGLSRRMSKRARQREKSMFGKKRRGVFRSRFNWNPFG